jgi:hypothetical protein
VADITSELLKDLRAEPGMYESEWQLINEGERRIGFVRGRDESEAGKLAREIEHRCNSHAELVETLQALHKWFVDDVFSRPYVPLALRERVRSSLAIAKAEGQSS